MKGSVKKDPNTNNWYYVVDVGIIKGRRKQARKRGFKTQEDAKIALNKFIKKSIRKSSDTTVTQLLEAWLENKTSELNKLTIDSYRSYITKHVVPLIGEILLSDITVGHFDKMIGDLSNKITDRGQIISNSSVQKMFSFLIAAMDYGQEMGLLTENIARLANKPSIRKQNDHVLSERDLEEIIIKNMHCIEDGMKFVDNQVKVKSGRIDILARDIKGTLCIIELKIVDNCYDLITQCVYYPTQFSEPVRMITICPNYNEKIKTVMLRIGDIEMKTYEFLNNKIYIRNCLENIDAQTA